MNERCVVCGKPERDMELVARREWRRSCCGVLYGPHVPAAPYGAPTTAGLSEKRVVEP